MKTKKLVLKNQIKDLHRAIAEKCMDCVNYQPSEILKCEINACSLWLIRPKTKKGLRLIRQKHLKQKELKYHGQKQSNSRENDIVEEG